jgi:hypothetical protein
MVEFSQYAPALVSRAEGARHMAAVSDAIPAACG